MHEQSVPIAVMRSFELARISLGPSDEEVDGEDRDQVKLNVSVGVTPDKRHSDPSGTPVAVTIEVALSATRRSRTKAPEERHRYAGTATGQATFVVMNVPPGKNAELGDDEFVRFSILTQSYAAMRAVLQAVLSATAFRGVQLPHALPPAQEAKDKA